MKAVSLCRFSELSDLDTQEFVSQDPNTPSIFLIKKNDQVFAYQNSCPHTGAPLNWQANRFLNSQKDKFLCTLHGALFNIDTGLCSSGPCIGDHLQKVDICIEEDVIWLNTK